jgi:type VI secretion system secreted protein Hcp
MRKKLLWAAVVVALVATPAVVGVLALGGDDSRRSGALIQPGTGGYELLIAGLPPSGQAMQVQSYSWGGSAPTVFSSGSLTRSGAARMTELSIAKKIDSASPLLIKGLVAGTRYASATLTLYKGERAEKYMEYKMTNVLISSVQHGGTADDVPAENVSFVFERLETNVEDKDEGGKVQANTYTWDVNALKQ